MMSVTFFFSARPTTLLEALGAVRQALVVVHALAVARKADHVGHLVLGGELDVRRQLLLDAGRGSLAVQAVGDAVARA